MATPPKPAADDDFTDSDRAWWDALNGRPAPDGSQAPSEARREGDLLRRALAAREIGARPAPPEADIADATSAAAREQRWQQLQFRLRREGRDTPRATGRPDWLRRAGIGGALAAGLVALAVLVPRIGPLAPDYDEPPAMRGDFEQVRNTDAAPKAAAERLAGELRAVGLAAPLYQQGKVYSVQVSIDADTPAAALAILRRAGARAAPGAGRTPVRIEFAPR